MDLTVIAGAVLASAGGLYALVRLLRALWRVNKRVVRTVDMVPRMAELVEELSPNHGHSIKDVVTRTEAKVDDLGRKLADHIENHPGG